MPSTEQEDPDGTYAVGSDGVLRRYEEEENESDQDLEQVMPEEEHYSFIVRRSLHTTPKSKKSDQRENIFQTKCRV